jgi:hypothetical protein
MLEYGGFAIIVILASMTCRHDERYNFSVFICKRKCSI